VRPEESARIEPIGVFRTVRLAPLPELCWFVVPPLLPLPPLLPQAATTSSPVATEATVSRLFLVRVTMDLLGLYT